MDGEGGKVYACAFVGDGDGGEEGATTVAATWGERSAGGKNNSINCFNSSGRLCKSISAAAVI